MKHRLYINPNDPTTLRVKSGEEIKTMTNIFAASSDFPLRGGILPPVVKSVSSWIPVSGGQRIFLALIERKPEKIACRFNKLGGDADQDVIVEVAVPWQHWFMAFAESKRYGFSLIGAGLYFSKTKIEGPDHTFYHPWLPNVFLRNPISGEDQPTQLRTDETHVVPFLNICFGEDWNMLFDDIIGNFEEVYNRAYTQFWYGGTFNNDLTSCLKGSQPTTGNGLSKKVAGIKFDEVLSDEVFKTHSQGPAFNFFDWLLHLQRWNSTSFDFAQLFTENLSMGKAAEHFRAEQAIVNGVWKASAQMMSMLPHPYKASKKTLDDKLEALRKVVREKEIPPPSMRKKLSSNYDPYRESPEFNKWDPVPPVLTSSSTTTMGGSLTFSDSGTTVPPSVEPKPYRNKKGQFAPKPKGYKQ